MECLANHGDGNMNINLKLKDCQKEQITVRFLEELHQDLTGELRSHDITPYLDSEGLIGITRSAIAIEIVMKDLLFEDDYFLWKARHGIDTDL
tara:strand:+ start:45 stop:323 length:279 start_codon:yes stop_codon:yes gene_type:complete